MEKLKGGVIGLGQRDMGGMKEVILRMPMVEGNSSMRCLRRPCGGGGG